MVRGEASEIRAAHSRYFAGREANILDLWDRPRQREAYTWFTTELANLRTAFRWAADHGDLDIAAPTEPTPRTSSSTEAIRHLRRPE